MTIDNTATSDERAVYIKTPTHTKIRSDFPQKTIDALLASFDYTPPESGFRILDYFISSEHPAEDQKLTCKDTILCTDSRTGFFTVLYIYE